MASKNHSRTEKQWESRRKYHYLWSRVVGNFYALLVSTWRDSRKRRLKISKLSNLVWQNYCSFMGIQIQKQHITPGNKCLISRPNICHARLLAVNHILGIYNVMADFSSREHITDLIDFLKLLNSKFKPPQENSWLLYWHSKKLTWRICSELLQWT